MKLNFVFTLLIPFVLSGCKKEKVCELNDANFAGVFKVRSVVYKNSATDPGTDDFLNWPACRKDDLWHFNQSNTTLQEDAGALCYPGGNSNGHWALSGSTVVLDGQSGTVISFDCKNTVIFFPQTTPNTSITLSLIRQ